MAHYGLVCRQCSNMIPVAPAEAKGKEIQRRCPHCDHVSNHDVEVIQPVPAELRLLDRKDECDDRFSLTCQ